MPPFQNGMLAFSDPRIVEQAFQDIGQNLHLMDHVCEMDAELIRGLSRDNQVLYEHHNSNVRQLELLSVKFHTFLRDFQHVMNEHLGPLQETFPTSHHARPCKCWGINIPPNGSLSGIFPDHSS
jgi:hypothetical protein